MVSFKLGSFGKGRALKPVSVSDDITLAEVLAENGYPINSNVDASGQSLDVEKTVGQLNLDGKFVIVKGEVKTSGAEEQAKTYADLLEENRLLKQQVEGEDTTIAVPQPIIKREDGSSMEFPAEKGTRILEWMDQFADRSEIVDIKNANGESVSPYSEVSNVQYTIIIK